MVPKNIATNTKNVSTMRWKFDEAIEWIVSWMSLSGSMYRRASKKTQLVIDVGCGNGQITRMLTRLGPKLQTAYLVGVDIWPNYWKEARTVYHDLIKCDIRKLPIQSSSFDLAIVTDVLEHLTKEDGYGLLKTIEDVARNQVFVFTPVGYSPKESLEDKNPWQAHKSGWHPHELKARGYRVRGMDGARFLYGERREYALDFRVLRAIMFLCRMWSQIVTFMFVEQAYHMLCVKEQNRWSGTCTKA